MPPEHSRWQPGGPSPNPGGRPKGSPSIRAALRRELAAGYESDPDGIGAKAVMYARGYLEAVESGDLNKIRAYDALNDQVEGKPTEHVQRDTTTTRTIIVRPGPETPPEMP